MIELQEIRSITYKRVDLANLNLKLQCQRCGSEEIVYIEDGCKITYFCLNHECEERMNDDY